MRYFKLFSKPQLESCEVQNEPSLVECENIFRIRVVMSLTILISAQVFLETNITYCETRNSHDIVQFS